MAELLLELLQDRRALQKLPEVGTGAIMIALANCTRLGKCVAASKLAINRGIFDIGASMLRDIGSPADMISISNSGSSRTYAVLCALGFIGRALAGASPKDQHAAYVASGLVDICIQGIQAFADRGAEMLGDCHHWAIYNMLAPLRDTRHLPQCEKKIRSVASALSFCLDNSLPCFEELGYTTGATATLVCCGVFGRGASDVSRSWQTRFLC
jgi:hypothetical protein